MNFTDYVLRYRQGEGGWQVYDLLSENTLIGRGEDNDLILDHREVSRHHLRIRFQDDVFKIVDLESSNGTRLDGVLLVPQIPSPLRPGQIVEVGDFSLVLEKSEERGTRISSEMLPYLIRYRFGTGTWQTFPLEPGEKLIGRNPDCDFHLNDVEVSRQHVRIRIEEDGIWLTDLGSTNGTQIEDIELVPHTEHPLQLGQIFSVGNFILQIDEPSRFYKAPSAVSGKPGVVALAAPRAQVESMPTVIDEDAALFFSVPVRSVNLLSRKRVKIGRAPENDLVLNHPSVNGYHAVIEKMGTRFRIQDLRSMNGVFINGKPIEREAFLKDWDQIRIGALTFVLSGDDLRNQVVPGLKLEARNIRQQVTNTINLLQDIKLMINPNELVALVGSSNSGKTTLLKALSGYWPASHGGVLINDVDLYEYYNLLRNDIGFVPQRNIVHPELTPETALNYAARLRLPRDITKQERRALVSEVLNDLNLMAYHNMPISRLPEAQARCVSIGYELLIRPRLLYLDEPPIGFDQIAEYDILKLLRRLANQGRTVISITQPTKNVMLCDKVIILAQGGNLAFFGSPTDAVNYFVQYRTGAEHAKEEIGFDDIYRILREDALGTPLEWQERYLSSQAYQLAFGIEPRLAAIETKPEDTPPPAAAVVLPSAQRNSGFHQLFITFSRNLKVLARDKFSLTIMLALAPLLGIFDFIWGRDLYDPVNGDAGKIVILWFATALVTLLIGALSSMREIVKELGVYKHERMVNLKLLPYLLSKVWLGVVLGLYQAVVLLIFKYIFVAPNLPSSMAFLTLYITFFLGITTGYLTGLLISAVAPTQNAAVILVAVFMVLQILFAGALIPLDTMPGGMQISVLMPSRWIFESFVRVTELGDALTGDPCWMGYDNVGRNHLSVEVTEACPCIGASIFTACADFPGILSPNFYDAAAQVSLVAVESIEPPQPTAYAYPTAYPSPTPLPTPTLLPSLTPYPTSENPEEFSQYMEDRLNQAGEYQVSVSEQFEQYRLDNIAQYEEYTHLRTSQVHEYADLREAQVDEYFTAMRTHNNERSSRDKAVNRAEILLGSFYDNYHQIFQGTLVGRWVAIIFIQLGIFILIILAQKRKDLVNAFSALI